MVAAFPRFLLRGVVKEWLVLLILAGRAFLR